MAEEWQKRVLPYDADAEKSVLGAMLMDKDQITVVSEIITGEDFYINQNRKLFEAITELYNEGKPADLITVRDRLREKEVSPEVSDMAFVSDILNTVQTSANARYYANIIMEKSTLRKLIKVSEDVANACYVAKDPLDTILDTTEKNVFKVVSKRNFSDYVPISVAVNNQLDKIAAAARSKGPVTGIATGFVDLDYNTAGLQNSDLILVAARPSMGKTAFALNIAEYVAVKSKTPMVIFSLEMSKEQLVNRMFSLQSGVDAQKLRTGNLSEAEWEELVDGAGRIGESKLIIDDTPGISISELRSKCRKYKVEYDISLIMIDYLQLMTGSGKTDSRQQEISDISRALKSLARELSVPVVALSQLSRAVEQRPDHRPQLSDLRESGAIEQDADVVMFIYREDYYNKDTERKGISDIIIAKQRNGPIGTVELAWLPELTKFANLAKSDRNRN